jgi:hypothetical protein
MNSRLAKEPLSYIGLPLRDSNFALLFWNPMKWYFPEGSSRTIIIAIIKTTYSITYMHRKEIPKKKKDNKI